MHILWLQLFYVLAIFAVGVIGGRAPGRKSGAKGGDATMALGEAFSGGVFLGAGLLHLLPDSIDNFSKFTGDIDFPFASLVAGIGLLLILLFDLAARQHSADGDKEVRPDQAPILLFLVLSIHSIIAGAALGLEAAGVASMAIFIAILAHKGSAGFALGLALVKGGVNEARRNRTILLFAVMTPLGVGLGTFLASAFRGEADIVFEAFFDALAAGTFLYITAFDILPKAMQSGNSHWVQWVMATIGFAMMALIAIWA
jgi:solute carrier family 39 (zinc transporter), member 1/2/3